MSTENEIQDSQATEVNQEVAPAEQVNEASVAELVSAEDAAIQAGFNSVNGIEDAVIEPEAPRLIAGYTEDEVKKAFATIAALEQRESKIFGSMGSMKQSIDSLRTNQQAPVSAPVLNWGPDKLKRLSAEFPELASMLAQDLGDMSLSGGQANPQQIEQIVEQRLKTSMDKTSQAYESRFLSVQHPDWKKVVVAEDFVGWKETLPATDKAELDASWDAEFIGDKISEFKAWKAQASQSKQTNQRRLEAAITPKSGGSGRPASSETDAFLAGFKSVRG